MGFEPFAPKGVTLGFEVSQSCVLVAMPGV